MTRLSKSALLIVGLGLAASSLAVAAPADAATEKRRYKTDRSFDYRTPVRRDPNSYDYARARNIDPGGTYKSYPDWAAYALSPKNDNNRR